MSNISGSDNSQPGSLYVVATPIGNLDDLTRRAEHVLKSVQIIAAEDTRRTAGLLAHIGHRAPELISLHDHNEHTRSQAVLARMLAGDDVALVSDAGTPLINDPGYELVQLAAQHGVVAVPVPGASSITAALSVCPFPCQTFTYLGFLAPKQKARRRQLADALSSGQTLVFLEAPHRLRDALGDMAALSERRLMLGRELTKKFEQVLTGTAAELLALLPEPRGEFVGVIEGDQHNPHAGRAREVLEVLLAEVSPAAAARMAAAICGHSKSQMYELALQIAGKGQ